MALVNWLFRGASSAVSAGSGPVTIDYPAGVVAGDIVLVVACARDTLQLPAPPGFARVHGDVQNGNMRTVAWWRRMEGITPSTVLIQHSAAGQAIIARAFAWRPPVGAGVVIVQDTQSLAQPGEMSIAAPGVETEFSTGIGPSLTFKGTLTVFCGWYGARVMVNSITGGFADYQTTYQDRGPFTTLSMTQVVAYDEADATSAAPVIASTDSLQPDVAIGAQFSFCTALILRVPSTMTMRTLPPVVTLGNATSTPTAIGFRLAALAGAAVPQDAVSTPAAITFKLGRVNPTVVLPSVVVTPAARSFRLGRVGPNASTDGGTTVQVTPAPATFRLTAVKGQINPYALQRKLLAPYRIWGNLPQDHRDAAPCLKPHFVVHGVNGTRADGTGTGIILDYRSLADARVSVWPNDPERAEITKASLGSKYTNKTMLAAACMNATNGRVLGVDQATGDETQARIEPTVIGFSGQHAGLIFGRIGSGAEHVYRPGSPDSSAVRYMALVGVADEPAGEARWYADNGSRDWSVAGGGQPLDRYKPQANGVNLYFPAVISDWSLEGNASDIFFDNYVLDYIGGPTPAAGNSAFNYEPKGTPAQLLAGTGASGPGYGLISVRSEKAWGIGYQQFPYCTSRGKTGRLKWVHHFQGRQATHYEDCEFLDAGFFGDNMASCYEHWSYANSVQGYFVAIRCYVRGMQLTAIQIVSRFSDDKAAKQNGSTYYPVETDYNNRNYSYGIVAVRDCVFIQAGESYSPLGVGANVNGFGWGPNTYNINVAGSFCRVEVENSFWFGGQPNTNWWSGGRAGPLHTPTSPQWFGEEMLRLSYPDHTVTAGLITGVNRYSAPGPDPRFPNADYYKRAPKLDSGGATAGGIPVALAHESDGPGAINIHPDSKMWHLDNYHTQNDQGPVLSRGYSLSSSNKGRPLTNESYIAGPFDPNHPETPNQSTDGHCNLSWHYQPAIYWFQTSAPPLTDGTGQVPKVGDLIVTYSAPPTSGGVPVTFESWGPSIATFTRLQSQGAYVGMRCWNVGAAVIKSIVTAGGVTTVKCLGWHYEKLNASTNKLPILYNAGQPFYAMCVDVTPGAAMMVIGTAATALPDIQGFTGAGYANVQRDPANNSNSIARGGDSAVVSGTTPYQFYANNPPGPQNWPARTGDLLRVSAWNKHPNPWNAATQTGDPLSPLYNWEGNWNDAAVPALVGDLLPATSPAGDDLSVPADGGTYASATAVSIRGGWYEKQGMRGPMIWFSGCRNIEIRQMGGGPEGMKKLYLRSGYPWFTMGSGGPNQVPPGGSSANQSPCPWQQLWFFADPTAPTNERWPANWPNTNGGAAQYNGSNVPAATLNSWLRDAGAQVVVAPGATVTITAITPNAFSGTPPAGTIAPVGSAPVRITANSPDVFVEPIEVEMPDALVIIVRTWTPTVTMGAQTATPAAAASVRIFAFSPTAVVGAMSTPLPATFRLATFIQSVTTTTVASLGSIEIKITAHSPTAVAVGPTVDVPSVLVVITANSPEVDAPTAQTATVGSCTIVVRAYSPSILAFQTYPSRGQVLSPYVEIGRVY